MQYERLSSSKLAQLATQYPAVVVTGARQSGKTTLLKQCFPSYQYVSLDLPSEAEHAENDPDSFLATYPLPLIVDEVQYAPQLFRHLKHRIDQNRDLNGQFILSGSQKFPLMKEVSDSLAGRIAIIELEPLSSREILAQPELPPAQKTDPRCICRGGFPELWKQPTLDPADYFRAYLATYIERDVRQILNVTSLRDYERFIRLCAARNGQLLNKTELAKGVGVSAKTIGEWLSVLEASNQICFLEPYLGNIGKRIVRSPKLYFCDTGLLCFLLGVDETSLRKSPFLGAIWETYIYAELRKYVRLERPSETLWFYRDGAGREVDFIHLRGTDVTLIESKWTPRPSFDDSKWMRQLATFFRERAVPAHSIQGLFFACSTPKRFPISSQGDLHAINGIRIVQNLGFDAEPV